MSDLTKLAPYEGSWVVVHDETGSVLEIPRDEIERAEYFNSTTGYTVYGYLEYIGMLQLKNNHL